MEARNEEVEVLAVTLEGKQTVGGKTDWAIEGAKAQFSWN